MPVIRQASDVLSTAQNTDVTLLKRLRPYVFGPQAGLHRYNQPSERAGIFVDFYQFNTDTTYHWPNPQDPEGIIDLAYAKVWIQDALLNYFNNIQGVGSNVSAVAGFTNRVRASTLIFQSANGFTRTAALGDRDVMIGDIIQLRNGSNILWSSVSGFAPDMSAAIVGAATADSNNKNSQSESANISQVAGTPLNEVVAAADGTAYSSLADGYITRTYTITVIQGSTGGNATTALLQVTSADGLDNQASIAPSPFGSPTNVGTKGLKVTWSLNAGDSVSGIDDLDFLLGQQWTCTVSQNFTPAVATSGGGYTGPSNTSYIVKVTLGGLYTDPTPPQITISASTGIDSSGPTSVSAASVFVGIGNFGTEIKFNQTGLRKGDVYYVPCTASAPAQVRTLVLKNDLSAALLAASNMDLHLYILEPVVQVPAQHSLPSVGTAWTAAQSGITINADLELTTTGLTNSGVPVYVPVQSASTPGYGKVFVEYREWIQANADQVLEISKLADVASTLGIVDPDNPIAFGVNIALQNTASAVLSTPNPLSATNSDIIKCAIVKGDPLQTATWQDALNLAAGEDNAYNLVPLTLLPAVQKMTAAQVEAQSDQAVQNFSACTLSAQIVSPAPLVTPATSTDGNVVLATIAQEPNVSPTEYILVSVAAGNANFITNHVQPGDTVRYLYTLDAFGNESWTEFTVASVVSESSLLLVAGPAGAVSVAQRLEVWHPVSPTDVVAQLAAQAASYKSKRVVLVWPDNFPVSGVTVAGYFACAMVAGLAGSVCSHQGLRNVQVLGADSFPRSRNFLRTTQLDALGAAGIMVLTTSPDAVNYIRWAVTTDPTELETREEMIRRDLDMFSLNLLNNVWGQFIGNANVTGSLISALNATLSNFVSRILRRTNVGNLGPAINSATVNTLVPDPVNLDQVDANLTVVGPDPNNKINLTIQL